MTHPGEQVGRGIAAIIFDLDGTLIDSESLTERAVAALVREVVGGEDEASAPPRVDRRALHGVTWASIAGTLGALYPRGANRLTADALEARFGALAQTDPPAPVPGAPEALRAAAEAWPVAVATSSGLGWATTAISALGLMETVRALVVAGDYARSKPAPDCYLLAAERLQVTPSACLVFEDSVPGLRAARAAGMRTIAVTHRAADPSAAIAIADASIPDYRALPSGYFQRA